MTSLPAGACALEPGPGLDGGEGELLPGLPEVEGGGEKFGGEEGRGSPHEGAHEAAAVPVPCGHEGNEEHVAIEHLEKEGRTGVSVHAEEVAADAGKAGVGERDGARIMMRR